MDTGSPSVPHSRPSANGLRKPLGSRTWFSADRSIRRLIDDGRIVIDPYDDALMQPASLDVRVDRLFRVFRNSRYPFIDVRRELEGLTELVEIEGDEPFILHPGEFVLGSTLERIALPDDLVARLEGKSSLGRLGLLIHSTAGFIDPGWDGHVTLELSNVANLPITIYPEMKIGQLSFVQLLEPAEHPYGSTGLGSKYQGQRGPTPSRYWKNFEGQLMILVTGANGFVGGHVVRALVDAGERVRALVRDASGAGALDGVDCELVRGDVTDPESLRAAARGLYGRRSPGCHPHRQARRFRARDDAGDAAAFSKLPATRECTASSR